MAPAWGGGLRKLLCRKYTLGNMLYMEMEVIAEIFWKCFAVLKCGATGIAKASIDILKVLSEYGIRSCDCRHPCVSALPFLHCAQHRQRWRHCDKCRNWFIFLFSMSFFSSSMGKFALEFFWTQQQQQQQLERRVRVAQTCARSTFIHTSKKVDSVDSGIRRQFWIFCRKISENAKSIKINTVSRAIDCHFPLIMLSHCFTFLLKNI